MYSFFTVLGIPKLVLSFLICSLTVPFVADEWCPQPISLSSSEGCLLQFYSAKRLPKCEQRTLASARPPAPRNPQTAVCCLLQAPSRRRACLPGPRPLHPKMERTPTTGISDIGCPILRLAAPRSSTRTTFHPAGTRLPPFKWPERRLGVQQEGLCALAPDFSPPQGPADASALRRLSHGPFQVLASRSTPRTICAEDASGLVRSICGRQEAPLHIRMPQARQDVQRCDATRRMLRGRLATYQATCCGVYEPTRERASLLIRQIRSH